MRSIQLTVVCLAALVATAGLAQAGTIAQWDFTGGNLADLTGNGHTATSNGAVLTADRFGNPNNAFDFNRPSSITTVGWGGGLPATATFSLWAQADVFVGSMLFNAGNSGQGPDLFTYSPGNYIAWNTWDSGSNSFGTFAAGIPDHAWHQFTVVNDPTGGATGARLYIDGTLFGTAGYRAANSAFTIGNSHFSGPWGWDGAIDDVKIFDMALTADEVSSLYSTGSLNPVAVPLPSSFALLGLGLFGLIFHRRRQGAKAS